MSWAEDRPGGLFGGRFRSTWLPGATLVVTPFLAVLFWKIAVQHDGSVLDLLGGGLFQGWPLPGLAALKILVIWSAVQALLLIALPGDDHLGPPAPCGERPRYRLNGELSLLVTLVLWLVARGTGLFDPSVVYDRFGELLVTSSLVALLLCVGLYFKGIRAPSTGDASASGNRIWDYWNGVELHPRVFGIELKQLFNCRIAMMGWFFLLLCFGQKQVDLHGRLDPAMAASMGLQLLYILKFFRWESGYFATLDITHDRFGFYLCWGVMAWLPALYTLVGLYLVDHVGVLNPGAALLIFALGVAALWANYDADAQRQRVRESDGRATVWGQAPELIDASYTTADGEQRQTILLASGWWKVARKFNYVAELSLAAAWTLPAFGFGHLLPWSYLIFLSILLVDRTRRDERRCAAKYGEAWDVYKRKVPWRMIPGIW